MKSVANSNQSNPLFSALALSLSTLCFTTSGCGETLSRDGTHIFGKDTKNARASGIEVDIVHILEDSDRERWVGASVTIPEHSKSSWLTRSLPSQIRFQEAVVDSNSDTLYLYEVTLHAGSLYVSTVTVASNESNLRLPITGSWEKGEAGGFYVRAVK